jgi:hypothetical protein
MSDETRAYPRWLYHPDSAPSLVNSPEEEEALGSGWVDSPHGFNILEPGEPEPCPYCSVYQDRIKQLEDQIIELEKAKVE